MSRAILKVRLVREDDAEVTAEKGTECVAVRAEALVTLSERGLVQRLTSGGLDGIEAYSAPEYFADVEYDQLVHLREELLGAGFSRTEIDRAVANAEREP